MFDFKLYSIDDFSSFEKIFFASNKNKDLVLLNLGTKKFNYDSFGVELGDELKKLNFFVYGCSKREINGKNFAQVIDFIKKKHTNCKLIVIDSVYVAEGNKPILIYREGQTRVSCLNSTKFVGDASILFNSFSQKNRNLAKLVIFYVKKMFKKYEEKLKKGNI